MVQDKFTNLGILNIEREQFNKINNEDILNKFAEKDRKM